MIYISDNKTTLCKGDFRPASLYKGNDKIAGYTTKNFEGEDVITLANCHNDKLYNVTFSGGFEEEKISVRARGKNILKDPRSLSSWEKGAIEGRAGYAYILDDVLRKDQIVTLSFDYNSLPSYLYFLTDDEEIPLSLMDEQSGLRIVYLTTTSLIKNKLTFTVKEGKRYALLSFRSSNFVTEETAQTWLNRFSYIQLETGGKATEFETYIEPQTFEVGVDEVGEVVFPTFKGTTVYEVFAEPPVKMAGMYKRTEV